LLMMDTASDIPEQFSLLLLVINGKFQCVLERHL